jgi:hypothetical protein
LLNRRTEKRLIRIMKKTTKNKKNKQPKRDLVFVTNIESYF